MVVVGNKLDLAKTKRVVSKEEGKALADEFGAAFMEVTVRRDTIERKRFKLICISFSSFLLSL